MNRERAKELLPIIQAYVEGKDIQFRSNEYEGSWIDMPTEDELTRTFPAEDYQYRIKPEPMEVWLVFHNDTFIAKFNNKVAAHEYMPNGNIKHFREVTE